MWGNAIEAIVAGDHPTVRAANPTTWIKSTDYCELEFGSSLEAFTRQRARLLALLESLPPKGWSRSATVVGGGSPIERTVHDYAARLARHERSHWKQIESTVKAVVTG
jgi:DinB superfamily